MDHGLEQALCVVGQDREDNGCRPDYDASQQEDDPPLRTGGMEAKTLGREERGHGYPACQTGTGIAPSLHLTRLD
jgi:hypothetical protein